VHREATKKGAKRKGDKGPRRAADCRRDTKIGARGEGRNSSWRETRSLALWGEDPG